MLTEKQKAALRAEAALRSIDADDLIAEAEGLSSAPKADGPPEKAGATPPLYMYHLPFVTVNEVRTRWLGLDSVTGGEQYASEWAAEHAGAPAATKPPA
jgi:hypothetical protein